MFLRRAMLGILRWTLRARAGGLYRTLPKCSSSTKKPDDSEESKELDHTKKAALDKLASLLSDMKIESVPSSDPSSISFKLAKPGMPRKPALKESADKAQGLQKEIVKAVKEVAESLGGDKEKTESELLSKLRSHTQEKSEGSDPLGSKDRALLGDLFVGMKIDRKGKRKVEERRSGFGGRGAFMDPEVSRSWTGTIDALAQAVNKDQKINRRKAVIDQGAEERVELDTSTRLEIFTKDIQENPDAPRLKTWEKLQQRELRLLATPPPKNAYEEMILWTEQGKLWKFPINNEDGMDEEAKVDFTEHVFLEGLIADFPKKGPVRHFMELVTVGLSQNPHISVQRKHEHIDWFRQYFREKQEVLKISGALPLEEAEKEETRAQA